ncbi:MAG: cytochrome c [Gammaproteobacteria bacterium]
MRLLSIACLMIGMMSAAQAAGDAEVGRSKAETCLGCHGISTYKNAYPTYHVPKLGGQSATYIISALKAYKSDNRPHATMHSQAYDLSDEDMADIAAYFSSLKDLK